MTEQEIKQLADEYADKLYKDGRCTESTAPTIQEIYIAGAHSLDEEIEELKEEIESLQEQYNTCFEGFTKRGTKLGELMKENVKLRNPWITDRDPEIKGSISDAVLLLIDGLFYRVSRLERRKDGSEFWWGADVANGEEVTAWMPIPELEKGE